MNEYLKDVIYLGTLCFGFILGLIMIWGDKR